MLQGGGGVSQIAMTMLAQRCYTVVDFVGPTLENYVGPKFFLLSQYVGPTFGQLVEPTCWANVRLICWTNLRPMSNHTLGQHTVCQRWPNMSTSFLMAKPWAYFVSPTIYILREYLFVKLACWSNVGQTMSP